MKNYKLMVSVFLLLSREQIVASAQQGFEKLNNQEYDERMSPCFSDSEKESNKNSVDIRSDKTVRGSDSFSDSESDFYSCDDDASDSGKSVDNLQDATSVPHVKRGMWCDESNSETDKELDQVAHDLRAFHVQEGERKFTKKYRNFAKFKEVESTDL